MPLRFSIVVPTRNRAALLEKCLCALGELEYARDGYEVLVVDDGSEPAMEGVVGRHAGVLRVRCLRAEGGGPAAARNMALRVAEGEYVAFTDDDCRPDVGWLRAFDGAIAGLDEGDRVRTGFGGRIVDSPENGICGRASQMLVSFLYAYNERADGLRFFCSNNLVFPRSGLLAMGGFDESFPLAAAEDRYICARWLREGELAFVPEAVVEHRQMLGFRGFVRQQFRYGRGACQFWRRRMVDERARNRLLPGEFYGRMLQYPFGRVRLFEAVAMSLLLALSQAAVAAGYYWERGWGGKTVLMQEASAVEGSVRRMRGRGGSGRRMTEGERLAAAKAGGDEGAIRRLVVPSVLLILLHVFFMAYRCGQLPIVPAIPDEVVINDPAIALSRGQGLVASSLTDSQYGLDRVYAHFPPLYPYTESLAFRAFGVSSASLRFTTVLMSILSTVALLLVLLRLCRTGLMHWSMALFLEALYCTNPSLVALERMARMESMIGFLLLMGLWGIVLAMTRRTGANGQAASGLAPMLLAGLCGALCVAVHPEAMTAMLLLGGLMLYAVPVSWRVRWGSVGLFVAVPPVIGLLTFRSQLLAAVRQFLSIARDATKTNTSSLEFFTKVLPNRDLSRLNRTVFFLCILLMLAAAPVVYATVTRRLDKASLRYRVGLCLAVVSILEILLMLFALRMDDRRCQFLFGALLVCMALCAWGARPLRRWQGWVGASVVALQCCGAGYYLSARSDRVADMDPDRYMALVRQLPAGMSVATTPGLWLDMQEARRPFTLILYGLDGESNWRSDSKNPFDRFDIVILEDYYTVGKPWWRADAAPGRSVQRFKIGRDMVDVYIRQNATGR